MKIVRASICVFLLLFLCLGTVLSQGSNETELFGFAQKLFRDGVYDLAAEQFRQFLRDYPESDRAGEVQYMVGESHFMAKAYASAVSEFQIFLIRFPYHLRAKDVWHRKAECHLALEEYDEAGAAFLQFQNRFSIDDRAPKALLQAAESFLELGDAVRTKHALDLFLKEYPQSGHRWKAILLQARLYRLSSDPDNALILFDEVVASQVEHLAPVALFEKGQLFGTMHRFDEAALAYTEIIRTYSKSDIIDQAHFQLGLTYYATGDFQAAVTPFQTVVDSYPQSPWFGSSQLYLGHALRETGNDSLAILVYEDCLTTGPDSCHQEAQYGLALSLNNVGRTYEALEKLETVHLQFPQTGISSQAALKIGDLLLELGNFEAAVDKYRSYILGHPGVGTSDQLQMTIGEIYEKRMGRNQRAADEYRRVLTDYPQSPLTYDALLAIGRCYEKLGDFSNARSAYEDVVNTDPKSIFAEKAQERIEWIEVFRVRDLEGATAQLLALLERAQTESNEDVTFRIAEITFEKLKDFERTAELMESFLTEHPESPRGAEALSYVARSYEKSSRKAALEGKDSLRIAFLRQAEDAYRRLRDGYPDSQEADDAEFFLIQARYDTVSEPDSTTLRNMIERCQSFVDRYPRSDRRDEVRVRLGDACMNLAPWEGPRSYDEALAQFQHVSADSREKAEATLKMGRCYQAKDQCDLALDRFQEVMDLFPHSSQALDAQLDMARCYTKLKQYAQAIDAYRAIVYKYPQSQMARDVRIEMGDLFAERGDYLRAKEAYERILEQGYDIPPDLYFKMANVLRSLGHLDKAVAQYAAYLKADPGGPFTAETYYGLARVQEQRRRLAEAAEEYLRLIEEYPANPSVAEAKGRRALVLYDLGHYEASRTVSLEALESTVDDTIRLELEAKTILASYRLGDMVTAETRAKSFRKEQPQQEDYAAQFDLEKGIYYLSVNNGQDALLAFQNVIDEYPESRFVDNARYGIGSAFAEAGDYEKAVEAFRTLVQESPDSDLVPSVYLKLGNIYHLQMNFEDAAFAYKRVIDDEGAGDLVPAALFNLIRTHEAANRQDQALHWAQELIRRFPDYEDARRVRIKIGYLHAELGHYTEAVTALEEVLPDVDAEEESEVRYWIGESYYDSGKYDQALLEYLKVAYLGQAGGLWALTAEFKAGQAYEALGRIDEARRLYRRMVERYGVDSQWGQAAQERLRELGG